ncbi:pca operon transcription factor PcaQ [compost metagenome]
MIVEFVPAVVKQFHQRHPDAHVTVSSGTLTQLMAGLREGRLDFAVARADQVSAYEGVDCRVLFPDALRVVVCATHPLAALQGAAWADTRPYFWVGPPPGSQLRRELDYELTLAQEPAPKIRIEVSDAMANLRMLMDSALVGVMSHRVATVLARLGHVAILPLPYKASGSVVLCTPAGGAQTPLGESFLACVMEQARLRIQATQDGALPERRAALLKDLVVRSPGGRTP